MRPCLFIYRTKLPTRAILRLKQVERSILCPRPSRSFAGTVSAWGRISKASVRAKFRWEFRPVSRQRMRALFYFVSQRHERFNLILPSLNVGRRAASAHAFAVGRLAKIERRLSAGILRVAHHAHQFSPKLFGQFICFSEAAYS